MSEPRKNHLNIDGALQREEENVDSYKPIPEADQEFRTSKSSLGKSKEKVSADPAEEKLLKKEDEIKITPMSTEAKYDHRNGDTKIELDTVKRQFTGLTKEELQKYTDDPFWVRLRWFMFVLFWALWLCMLAGAIAIIVRAPKCAAPQPKTWYEKGPLVDYTSESVVDYTTLEQDLENLQEAKIAGIFINPCENTYDVLDDKTCVDKFKEFLKKAQDKSIKLIVDLTANFVSTSHKWFTASENGTADYDEYFVWAVGKDVNTETNIPNPPNNWKSREDTSAWSWSEKRKKHYLHQFKSGQADMNFHNEVVVKLFDSVLKTWVDAGASGVRLLKARQLLVNLNLTDEEVNPRPTGASHAEYGFYTHKMSSDQPKLANIFAHWSHLVAAGDNEKVFTIHEDGILKPEWYKYHNSSSLHPPSSAPLKLTSDISAVVAELNNATQHWPILHLSSDDEATNSELPAVAMLLRAAPVLAPAQLPSATNETKAFGQLSAIRSEPSVQFGQQLIAVVTDNNSTDNKLIAVARWKAGQPGYVTVLNPGPLPASANLTSLGVLPDTLAVHHVTPQVTLYTDYVSNSQVSATGVMVPANSALVLSFVPITDATE